MKTRQKDNRNKRQSLRINSKTLGQILNLGSQRMRAAIIDDVSTGGLRIKIIEEDKEFAETGDQVEISFNFLAVDDDHDEEEEIVIRGAVRYHKNEGQGWTIFGVQAMDNDSTRVEKLENTWLALAFENFDQ